MRSFFISLLVLICSSVSAQPERVIPPQGTDTTLYNFINPITSFIKIDSGIKNIGTVYQLPIKQLTSKIYLTNQFSSEFFNGRAEILWNIDIPLKAKPGLVLKLTPFKKKKFSYTNINGRLSYCPQWLSEAIRSYRQYGHGNRKTDRTDSVYMLKNKPMSFGDYMALMLMCDYNNINLIEFSYHFTRDSAVFNNFYKNYFKKQPEDINTVLSRPGCFDDCPRVVNLDDIGYSYNEIANAFDELFSYMKPLMQRRYAVDLPSLVKETEEWFSQAEYGNKIYRQFDTAQITDRIRGLFNIRLTKTDVGMQIRSRIIRPVNKAEEYVLAVVKCETEYSNLPKEKIELKKQSVSYFPDFTISKSGMIVTPKLYDIHTFVDDPMDDIWYGYDFHTTLVYSGYPHREPDEYLRNFAGIHIRQADLQIPAGRSIIRISGAPLIIDDKEVNGYFSANNLNQKEIRALKKFFSKNHFKTEFTHSPGNSKQINVIFNYVLK